MSPAAVLTITVPGLLDRPAVGTSCCVTSAEALLAQELWMLPGVSDAEIDPASGRVTIVYDPALLTPLDISGALSDVGYPPEPAP